MVENVHLSESLMTLSYNLSEYRKEHEVQEAHGETEESKEHE